MASFCIFLNFISCPHTAPASAILDCAPRADSKFPNKLHDWPCMAEMPPASALDVSRRQKCAASGGIPTAGACDLS